MALRRRIEWAEGYLSVTPGLLPNIHAPAVRRLPAGFPLPPPTKRLPQMNGPQPPDVSQCAHAVFGSPTLPLSLRPVRSP